MFTLVMMLNDKQMLLNKKQDGRLAPAYFSPNYKHFDQLLQTVKNKTTVLILVFKEFLQTSIPQLISVVSAKGYYDFPLKNLLSHSTEKFCRGTLLCYLRKFPVAKKFMDKRGGGGGGRKNHDFQSKIFCLTLPKNFVGEPISVSLISGIEKC